MMKTTLKRKKHEGTAIPQIEIKFVEYRFWNERQVVTSHMHDDLFQLDYFPQGEGTYQIDNTISTISSDAIYCVPPLSNHEIISSSLHPLENLTVKYCLHGIPDYNLQPVILISPSKLKQATAVFRSVISQAILQDSTHAQAASARMLELLLLLEKENRKQLYKNDNPVIVTAKLYMHDHFHEDISMDQISWAAGVGPEHLSRLFKKETGCTPFEFLRSLRIAKAQELLHHTRDSVAAVAVASGFGTTRNFGRAFQEVLAMSPREYRRKIILENQ